MNDLFGNLGWRMPMQSTPAGRWISWARGLSAGRRRIYSRHRLAVMQLLRAAIPIYRFSHRWELTARLFSPRINLVVSPVLPQATRAGFSSLRSFAQRSSGGIRSELRTEFLTSAQSTVKRLFQSRNHASAQAGGLHPSVGEAKVTRPGIGPSPVLQLFNEPLNRVFRRLLTVDIQTEKRQLISRDSAQIARRVVEETRRVERYGQTSMVTRQDSLARKFLETAKGNETRLLEQLAELNKAVPNVMHRGSPIAAPVAGFTIEQLTEQVIRRIDDQIVAHKERMGKLF